MECVVAVWYHNKDKIRSKNTASLLHLSDSRHASTLSKKLDPTPVTDGQGCQRTEIPRVAFLLWPRTRFADFPIKIQIE
jgi:hypothetical protein